MSRYLPILFLATTTAVVAQDRARPVDTSPRAVLAAAGTYLKAYHEALEILRADETTVQEVFDDERRRIGRRETSAEFYLSYMPEDGGWLSVREFTSVDGKAAPPGDDVNALFKAGSMARIARAVADRNSRYNIGSITRNFNDPMLALVILDPKNQPRFRFERRQVTQAADGPLVTLSFTERDRPTLIMSSIGSPVFMRGELTIDAATGRLQRSVITMKDGPTSASLTTTFAYVEKVALWLPELMVERYEHSSARGNEEVRVESQYTNFRKYGVTVRIR